MKKCFVFLSALALTNMSIAQDSIRSIQLEEVNVLGLRALENSAVSQTSIRKSQIEKIDLGQDAALQLEQLSPSIVTYSDAGSNFGNYQSFRLRGMDQSRINMTLNGVPLNDMLDQGVFFSNFIDFNNSVESIQIQRGVGTSTNGTSSYAGSINYNSISLYDTKPSAGLRLSGGSFNSMGLAAEASSGKLENNFSAYGRMSRNSSSGYKDYSGSEAQSFFFSGGYLGEKYSLKFTGFSGKTQNHQSYTPVLKSDIDKDPKTNNNDPNDVDDFEQDMAQLQFVSFINRDLTISSTVYYSGARGYFPFSFFGAQYNYGIRNDQYGILSNVQYLKGAHKFDGGIHAYTFNRNNETSVSPNREFPYYKDESVKTEVSAFIKDEISFPELNLKVFADLQFRTINMSFISDSLAIYNGNDKTERTFNFLNPKIGVTYQVNEEQNVYASFGRTGREPTRTDIFGGADGIYAYNYVKIISEDSMKAEYVNDFELGYRFNSNNIQLSLNAFYMNFENEISAVGGLAQNSYFLIRKNVASSQRYGLELDFKLNLFEKLDFSLMATYLETNVDAFNNGIETKNNVSHAYAPNIIVQPTIAYTLFNRAQIGISSRYLGEAYMELFNNPDYIIPSSLIFNAFLDFKINEIASFGIWLNNITNEIYFTDGAPVDSDYDGIPEGPGYRIQAPRNVFARLIISI